MREMLARRDGASGGREYLVCWEGYPDEADCTWEPEGNIVNAREKVREYLDLLQHGLGGARAAAADGDNNGTDTGAGRHQAQAQANDESVSEWPVDFHNGGPWPLDLDSAGDLDELANVLGRPYSPGQMEALLHRSPSSSPVMPRADAQQGTPPGPPKRRRPRAAGQPSASPPPRLALAVGSPATLLARAKLILRFGSVPRKECKKRKGKRGRRPAIVVTKEDA